MEQIGEKSHFTSASSAAGVSERGDDFATKMLHPLGITAKLTVIYQPRGLSEKGPRKPSRSSVFGSSPYWFEKMVEVEEEGDESWCSTSRCYHPGKRGLNRITRILENSNELNFRISLAKTTLMVESMLLEETVHQY